MTGLVMLHATLGLVNTAPRVRVDADFISASGSAALGATGRWRQNAAGSVQTKQGTAAYVTPYNWLLTGANTDYEIKLTEISKTGGSFTGLTGASWVAMTSDHEVTFVTGLVGSTNQGTFSVSIRDKTTLAVLDTDNIDIESEWI